jgi:hypothetical protein
MKNLQDAGIDNVFFGINHVENAHDHFRGDTSTEEKWRHDVFWAPSIMKQVAYCRITDV